MKKYPVTERALVARINRKLHEHDRMLRRCKEGSRAYLDFGRYYEVNTQHNGAVDTHVDIEELANELNCIKPHEQLVED